MEIFSDWLSGPITCTDEQLRIENMCCSCSYAPAHAIWYQIWNHTGVADALMQKCRGKNEDSSPENTCHEEKKKDIRLRAMFPSPFVLAGIKTKKQRHMSITTHPKLLHHHIKLRSVLA
jgi:hypothetical protein